MASIAFDSSVLSYFARSSQLGTLKVLTAEFDPRVVVTAVLDELAQGVVSYSPLGDVQGLGWLQEVDLSGLSELQSFAHYANVLGSGLRDIGEAATLAWAESHGATAVVDERAGVRAGRARGVDVIGTLGLVAKGVREHQLTEQAATTLVGLLIDAQAYFPFAGADEFLTWAKEKGVL